MIKKLFLIGIGVMLAASAMSQVKIVRDELIDEVGKEEAAFAVKYGVKVGVNLSTMSNSMSFDPGFGMGAGVRVGGFVNMRWGQRTENSLPGTGLWGFQPEVMYSNEAVSSDAEDIRMNLLSVPLLLKIYPTTGFSIEVGPEFSYLFSTSPSEITFDKNIIKVGDCSGMNIGVAAGLAYDFDFGLTLGARYTYRFADMAKNLKWKSNNIEISAGWMF